MKGVWKTQPDEVLTVMREAVIDWKIVEQATRLPSNNHSSTRGEDGKNAPSKGDVKASAGRSQVDLSL